MAIDLKSLDKKKIGILIGAVVAGLIAVALTGNYINESASKKAMSFGSGEIGRQMSKLQQQIDIVKKENQGKIIELDGKIRQQIQSLSKMKTSALPQVTKKRTGISLSTKTPSGKRAVTVLVDKLLAVGGMIAPGDYVDIIVHLAVPTDPTDMTKGELTSVTLFQNVYILAVNGKSDIGEMAISHIKGANESQGTLTVTLALFPEEVGLITFAQQNGRLQIVLRSPLDTQAFRIPASSWDSLSRYILTTQGFDIGVAKPPEPEEEPEPEPEIEIFKGGRF